MPSFVKGTHLWTGRLSFSAKDHAGTYVIPFACRWTSKFWQSASYPGLVMTQWFGLLAPAHTPPAVCDKLAAEFKKIYADPELQHKLSSLGLEATWIPGPELSQRIGVDLKKWRKLMAAANIHPE